MTLDQKLSIVSIIISSIGVLISILIALIGYLISRRLSAKNKHDHEVYVCNQLENVGRKKIILSNVKKYNSYNNDPFNETYSKQACGFERIIPVYGIVVALRGGSKGFESGLIPFEWIEYVRPYDSEDSSIIIVCKFKGIKWYENFRSPIKLLLKDGYLD